MIKRILEYFSVTNSNPNVVNLFIGHVTPNEFQQGFLKANQQKGVWNTGEGKQTVRITDRCLALGDIVNTSLQYYMERRIVQYIYLDQ